MEGVPRMPMLEIELKQNSFDYSALEWAGMPSEDVHEATQQQITEGLKKHIKEEYGDDPDKYKEAIEKFIEVESAAYKAILSPDFEGCNTLKKYFGQLHYMQSRFPFTGDDALKVTFAWQDAFTGILTVHESFTFEQSSILFNIGAIHSTLGAMDNRTTEEGIRISCVHFQCAAGLFSYVAEHFDTTMSADISQSMLKLFINIMLAQGQECLLEKSMQDNRKHSIVSKISQQVVDYYEQCRRSIEIRDNENALGSQAHKHWKRVVAFKIAYYSAITKYYMGNNSQDQDKYGQAVGLYAAAVAHLNDAAKLAKSIQKETRVKAEEAIKFTSDVLNGKYTSAVKDNEFVYHDRIPDRSSLPEIKGASLVKALPFDPANPTITGPDIFAKLVPMEAHLAASSYSEEKAKLLRNICEKIDAKNEVLNQYKQSIELDPNKLIKLDEVSKLDQALVENCALLSVDQSPIDALKEAMDGLSDVYSELDGVLNEILGLVEDEELEDQKLKNKCEKDAFSSQDDVDGIRKELQVYKEVYHKASQRNDDLHTACMVNIASMKSVAAGMDSIRDDLSLVDINDLLSEEDKNVVGLIRKLCDKVVEMEEQRKSVLKQLREQMEADDVTSTLVTKHGVDQEDLFKEELKKHDSLVDTINKNLSAQDNILDAVTEANARYTKIRKIVEKEKERVDTKVDNLVTSCETYKEVIHKCNEGRKFFAEILGNAAELLKRAREFHDENTEKRKSIYAKWEEKEKAKRPPPRPSAPKPKLEGKKKPSLTPVVGPPTTPASAFLSPDVLAKMMADDEDDELLNDPEFLQFLQAQGGLHGGVPPVMPGTAPLPRPHLPGRLPARPHTIPPQTSFPAGGRGVYPAVSSSAGMPGHLTHPAAPPPPGSYIPSSQNVTQVNPAAYSQPTPPPIRSPTPVHTPPSQIPSSLPGQVYPGDLGMVGMHRASTAPASLPPSQGHYQRGYVPQPQQTTPELGENTISTMAGPIQSLQDPRQVAYTPVSHGLPQSPATPPVSYQSQPTAIHLAHSQQHTHGNIQGGYMPNVPSPSQSPGPANMPVTLTHPPQAMSPQMIDQDYSNHSSPAHHAVVPATHHMSPIPQMVGQPQVVHHNFYVAQPVVGQRQQQQQPPPPVQVSQVAIVYSAPPTPQQASSCTYTQPNSYMSSAPLVQQGLPPQITPSQNQHLPGQYAIQGVAPGVSQPQSFSQPPQPQYKVPYQQGPVPMAHQPGARQTADPATTYQNYQAPVSSSYQPQAAQPAMGLQSGLQQVPQDGNMAYQGQFLSQQNNPAPQRNTFPNTPMPLNNQAQLPVVSGYQPNPPQGPRPNPGVQNYTYSGQFSQTQQPSQMYNMQRQPAPAQPQYHPQPNTPQQIPVGVQDARYQTTISGSYQAGQSAPQQQQPFTRAMSPNPYQQMQPGAYHQQQPVGVSQPRQPENFQQQYMTRPPMPGQASQQSGSSNLYQPTGQAGQQYMARPAILGQSLQQPGNPTQYRPAGQGGMPTIPGQPTNRPSVPGRPGGNQQGYSQSPQIQSQPRQPQRQQQALPVAMGQPQGYTEQPQMGVIQQVGMRQPHPGMMQQQRFPTSQSAPAPPSQLAQTQQGGTGGQMSQPQPRPDPGMQNFPPQNQNPVRPPVQHGTGPQQSYVFRSQPHPGQYFTIPSNENSPKHVPSNQGGQTSTRSADSEVKTTPASFREPIGVLQPTPVNEPKKPEPALKPNQPSSDLAGLILTPTRSLSTSADELLSTAPDPSTIQAKDPNQVVLVPTKIDEDGDSMVIRPVEGLPYMDEADLMKFKSEVVEFRSKVHNLLTKPEGNGLCHLDREWKQLSEMQERFSRQLSTAVARCSSYKNKFQDIVPFDQSRVILREAKDDYINASVIDGVSPFCPRFIATQSPLPNTCSDFWLMVYEQQVTLIVMLVNSKDVPKKCPMYWPADRAVPQQHGPLTVSFTTSKTHGDLYIERTFTIKHQKQSLPLSVTQLQYMAWPEHRLPSSATDLLNFMHVVQSYHGSQRNLQWPVLVHCESGVGRTGVFCAFLAGTNEINAGMGIMDVVDVVDKMRKKRKYMVQEKAQLKFVYDVILYHAVDVLKQRRVVLEDEVKPSSTPQQVHPPNPMPNAQGKFNIFSNSAALSSIQATVEKMTIKPGMEKMQKEQDYPMLVAPSKSCSDVSNFNTEEHHRQVLNARPQTSDQAVYGRQPDPVHILSSQSLGGISDLVQGTIPAPTVSPSQPAMVQSQVAQNVSVKPDIVESCSNQVPEKPPGSSGGSAPPDSLNGGMEPTPSTNGVAKSSPSPPNPAIIELMTPGGFTLDNPEDETRKVRRVTKEDFFKPSIGLASEKDPMDPFSGLDPLWGYKK